MDAKSTGVTPEWKLLPSTEKQMHLVKMHAAITRTRLPDKINRGEASSLLRKMLREEESRLRTS